MADGDDASPQVRAELIQLFEEVNWKITIRAETDGKAILLERHYKEPTQCGICDYILEKLRSGFRLRETGRGEPRGSRGIGWEMKDADGLGLYIKLKIEEGIVWVLSFHY